MPNISRSTLVTLMPPGRDGGRGLQGFHASYLPVTLSDNAGFYTAEGQRKAADAKRLSSGRDSTVTAAFNWVRDAKVTFRVEFENSLNAASWTEPGDFNATSASRSATNTVCGTPQRFYHLQQTN